MQTNNSAARRNWTKPEVVSISSANKAQSGNNSMAVDVLFPAANGAQAPIS
jgi:hypothetical protein